MIHLNSKEQKLFQVLLGIFPIIMQVDASVRHNNGRVFVVGGAVRNIIMELPPDIFTVDMDVDIEVHGLSLVQLQTILAEYGTVDYSGKSFGILRVRGYPIDWSIPRKDQSGRKPHIELVPNLSIEVALQRRDLTMNAMAIDCSTGELFDPFNGKNDIALRRLRTPDAAFFIEDPLRLYRVMQFIARFDLSPDAELQNVCTTIDISQVSRERVATEFEKLLLSAPVPSRGIRWLAEIGRLAEIMSELAATQGILQDATWHPEGDVFEHTMQAVDAAAEQHYDNGTIRRAVLYAVLCHDLGKVTTTTLCEGRIRSRGHDIAGVAPTRSLMFRIGAPQKLVSVVSRLVRHHMMPGQLIAQKSSIAAYKRLAVELAPITTLRALALVAYADKRGRNPEGQVPLRIDLPDIDIFVHKAEAAGILDGPERPLLSGEDIKDFVTPGPLMGKALSCAYEIQIEGSITDKEILLQRLRKLFID